MTTVKTINKGREEQAKKAIVGVIMGSGSDIPVMSDAIEILEDFSIPFEKKIVSAHRTPDWMFTYAKQARERDIQLIIAGAGGAAHLPGMVASLTTLPVIGVPIHAKNSLHGLDSILSILQMPRGVPVATVGLNNAANAALLALRILAQNDEKLHYLILQEQRESADTILNTKL